MKKVIKSFCFKTKKENTIFAASSSQIFNVATCIQLLKTTIGGNGGGSTVFGQWTGKVDQTTWFKLKINY
ncbi:hypothetical protein KHA80_18940 [Anaerobacillus sp. HL2]|nr:hypothetical protein KHA80_18940 [Anaerobacillus sp. HL2]